MKIGIFGGSFNPPHLTHKKIALELIRKNYVDRIIFVPTGDLYKKDDLIKSNDRFNMVKEMIQNDNNLDVSKYEMSGSLKYTYQTLRHFKKKNPNNDIYFICGADNLDYIKQWKNYEEILSNYKIIVLGRNNINLNNLLIEFSQYNAIIKANIKLNNISSTKLRNKLDRKYLDINVYNYIKNNNLYGGE